MICAAGNDDDDETNLLRMSLPEARALRSTQLNDSRRGLEAKCRQEFMNPSPTEDSFKGTESYLYTVADVKKHY